MQNVTASGELTLFPLVFRLKVQAFSDALSGVIITGMLIFGPWAFGCTEPWSIWTLNAGGYCLGFLLGLKLVIHRFGEPRNRSQSNGKAGSLSGKGGEPLERILVRGLAGICVLIPLYCLVGAVNARATYDARSGMLVYHECVSWLPHSLDSSATWDVFWRLLSLICWFWAVRGYLKGPSSYFAQEWLLPNRVRGSQANWCTMPTRLVGLFWVLIISGAALALEGIVQRLLHSPRLLFMRAPEMNQDPLTQFASFAYRANAAQYFNLLWPVCLGFLGWCSARADRGRAGRRLLPWTCVTLMALAPLAAGARTAALIDLAILIILGSALLAWPSRRSLEVAPVTPSKLAAFALIAGLLAFGAAWGIQQFWPRLHEWRKDLVTREQLYYQARLMARDYPVFGTGPGSFEHLYGLYRATTRSEWPAQVHNDWLETRITFGFVGSLLFVAALVSVVLVWVRSAAVLDDPLMLGLWVSVAGCLIQARWDFPLQIYSIDSLLIFWLAVSFSISVNREQNFARNDCS